MTFMDMKEIIGKNIVLILDEKVNPKKIGWTPYYIYLIKERNFKQIVGSIVFRLGDFKEVGISGHIGYTIDEFYQGHYYAYQATDLLLKTLIKAHGYKEIVITCLLDNIASNKTIKCLNVISLEVVAIPANLRKNYRGQKDINVYKVKVG